MQIFVHLLEFSKTDVGPFRGLFSRLWGDLFLDGVRPKVSRGCLRDFRVKIVNSRLHCLAIRKTGDLSTEDTKPNIEK